VIEYRRGRITVLDRPRLEQMACECYQVVKKEFARLLPWDNGQVPSVANGDRKTGAPPRRSRTTIAAN
jgi:hypothetical protein